ncbi:uncharacterized protein cubi_03302 [Cryptosporidium ubiquitum]|uniref:Uncharacterized protein n=1 Tax=Cryptosporidium ubiquitum TaxID=857276 RepID=A0A1J4MEB1_9CRYT|nr:uncharacterized protein cubi_03302 [Cryptosporidium ubiquitum]OII72566.1 hypothetical protein cubi_03302 [Cryptosporidium ubiquitum]
MGEFEESADYNDELCLKALNNLDRPPEIDEPFLEFFKPKPKLRIKQKPRGKSLDSSDVAGASTVAFGEELEHSGSISIQKSASVNRNELNILNEDYGVKSSNGDSKNIRRVRSEMSRFNSANEGMKAENLLSSILILPDQFGKKGSKTEVRKRKLNSSGSINSSKDEFLSVITPISPYVISPKSNNYNYSNGNSHDKKLTEKNIDLLNSLIEIKEKELDNLNTTYSYEKSEFKLEIIRLKQIIKESEESHLKLRKEIVEKDEALAESKQNYEKLELDFVSTKQSLEIMLEAERSANQRLKQELREKNAHDSSLGYFGENSILELQSYKLKYFEAMRKLQRLETERVISGSRIKGYKHEEGRELINSDSVPIFVGVSESRKYTSDYIPENLKTNLEVCMHIKEDFQEIRNDAEVIQLISENSLLKENIIKLIEELEIEKNKSIVANIRNLTQKPILISSCTSTRLSMHEIDTMEVKARQLEQRYEEPGFKLSRNNVNIQIICPKNRLNIEKLDQLEIKIDQNFESKLDKSIQTHVDGNMCVHVNTGNITEINVGSYMSENIQITQDEIKSENDISLYDLAFKDYNFVPKLLNNFVKSANNQVEESQECEQVNPEISNTDFKEIEIENKMENIKNKPIKQTDLSRSYLISRKCEFLNRVLLELKFEILELRRVVLNFMDQPKHFTETFDNLIKNRGNNGIDSCGFSEGEPLLSIVATTVLKAYNLYLKKASQVEEFVLKDREWRSYSDRIESELNKYSLEKSELVKEISYLKRLLNEKIEKEKITVNQVEKDLNIHSYNFNDEVMSCYTFGESSSANLENEIEWNIDHYSIKKLVNSRTNIDEPNIEPFSEELEVLEESKEITKVENESDSFNKIVKLQGRIRSFKQNRIKLQSSEKDDISLNNQMEKSLIQFKKNVFQDKNEMVSIQENIEFEDTNSFAFRYLPPQMNGDDLVSLGELEGMTGTAMMLRLYRYYKQTKLLEKQVIQLSKEKQKLELEYEKDAQSNQMNLLSSKLIIEARDMEIKTLKEKCEFLSNKVEDDIKNIKSAAREEIEKVWKPKVEEINSKCEDYLFKVSSLESELIILRQQLAFQKQLNSKDTKKSEYSSIIKGKYLSGINLDKYRFSRESIEKIPCGVDDLEIKRSDYIDDDNDESDSIIENSSSINIQPTIETRGDDSDDQNISSLKSALSKLKTISNEYRSFN